MSAAIQPGTKFGAWTVHGLDRTRKRVLCRCDCGAVRELGVGALVNAETLGCGCRLSGPQPRLRASDSFASSLAETEAHGASRRHRGGA